MVGDMCYLDNLCVREWVTLSARMKLLSIIKNNYEV